MTNPSEKVGNFHRKHYDGSKKTSILTLIKIHLKIITLTFEIVYFETPYLSNAFLSLTNVVVHHL